MLLVSSPVAPLAALTYLTTIPGEPPRREASAACPPRGSRPPSPHARFKIDTPLASHGPGRRRRRCGGRGLRGGRGEEVPQRAAVGGGLRQPPLPAHPAAGPRCQAPPGGSAGPARPREHRPPDGGRDPGAHLPRASPAGRPSPRQGQGLRPDPEEPPRQATGGRRAAASARPSLKCDAAARTTNSSWESSGGYLGVKVVASPPSASAWPGLPPRRSATSHATPIRSPRGHPTRDRGSRAQARTQAWCRTRSRALAMSGYIDIGEDDLLPEAIRHPGVRDVFRSWCSR